MLLFVVNLRTALKPKEYARNKDSHVFWAAGRGGGGGSSGSSGNITERNEEIVAFYNTLNFYLVDQYFMESGKMIPAREARAALKGIEKYNFISIVPLGIGIQRAQ